MGDKFFSNETVDFSQFIIKSAREQEASGDKRMSAKTFAHAWRAGASAKSLEITSVARLELFSVCVMINDLIFTSVLYRDLISTFSLDNRFQSACAHHDLGKLYRNAWECNEIINPNDAIKHFIAAKDEYSDLNEVRSSALVEMDLAHIYLNIEKVEQAEALLLSARDRWTKLDDVNGMAESALSLGDCYTLLGKNTEAELYYSIAAKEFDVLGKNRDSSDSNI